LIEQALQQTQTVQTAAAQSVLTTVISTQPAQSGCSDWVHMPSETVPDGTVIPSNTGFIKTWTFQNTGTCTWTTAYSLNFLSGEPMGAQASVSLPSEVQPGQSVTIAVNLVAPPSTGTYQGNWIFRDGSGKAFGWGPNADQPFWVKIKLMGSIVIAVLQHDLIEPLV
jgi:hypothetical protein